MLRIFVGLAKIFSYVFAIGQARMHVPFYVAVLILIIVSILFFYLPSALVVSVELILSVVIVIVRGYKIIVYTTAAFALFIMPYVMLAISIQFILKIMCLQTIIRNTLTMFGLFLLGTLICGVLDIDEVIIVSRKFSINLAMLLALVIKFYYFSTLSLQQIMEIYSVNIPADSFYERIKRFVLICKAVIYLVSISAINSVEAIYTRMPHFCGVLNNEEGRNR